MCADRPSTAITHHVQGPPHSPPALHAVLASSQAPSGPVLPHLSGPSVPSSAHFSKPWCPKALPLSPRLPLSVSSPRRLQPRLSLRLVLQMPRYLPAPAQEDPSHTHALVLPQPPVSLAPPSAGRTGREPRLSPLSPDLTPPVPHLGPLSHL